MPRSQPTSAECDEARSWLAGALRFERLMDTLRAVDALPAGPARPAHPDRPLERPAAA